MTPVKRFTWIRGEGIDVREEKKRKKRKMAAKFLGEAHVHIHTPPHILSLK